MRQVRRSVVASAFLAEASGPMQIAAWSGSWTLNPSLSTLAGRSFRITRVGNAYHFDFGGDLTGPASG